jgi:2,3-bisphosphoglycerate-independent phosphoglycerate mutase
MVSERSAAGGGAIVAERGSGGPAEVTVLVIPDGAAQPLRDGAATALQAADTPVLDMLARQGSVVRVATTPTGLPAGSETGIATLLGVPPGEPVGRGWVDAAAYGVELPDGVTPWRADVVYRDGRRASIRQARDICAHLGLDARAVSGHRLVILADERPADRRLLGLHVRVWPGGPPPAGRVPYPTTVVCAPGAAAGCARLLGADVVVPRGATGDVDSDLRAKAAAAVEAIERGRRRVVVHIGAPDEAAHRRDARAVVGAIERIDHELLAPLRDAVGAAGGRLAVCPDHGTDPVDGRHRGDPVPAVIWGAGVEAGLARRCTERHALSAPLLDPAALLRAPLEVA